MVKQIQDGGARLVVAHDAVRDYMPAMTMPFRLSATNESTGLKPGDRIAFQLHVTETESWIDHIRTTGTAVVAIPAESQPASTRSVTTHNPLLDFPFTNEFGQPVRLSQFRGQALAVTFFFTRCPVPDFCPRLSRNFEAVTRRMESMANAPTNWHLISITFDPEHDTPAVLSAYARSYHYDPAHWTFITGPADKIRELVTQSGMTVEPESGLFNHSFRTLIIDANDQLQMVFPTSGDFSDSIVTELLKAAAATNHGT